MSNIKLKKDNMPKKPGFYSCNLSGCGSLGCRVEVLLSNKGLLFSYDGGPFQYKAYFDLNYPNAIWSDEIVSQ